MRNRNHNIELPRRPSRSPPMRDSNPIPHHYNYLPQQDEQSLPEPPGNIGRELRYSISSKLRHDKVSNIAIILMICLYIIELPSLCYGWYYFLTQKDLKIALQDPVLRPIHIMRADLNADPIMNIQIMDQESTCPSGFEVLKLGVWHGTVAGCLCEDGQIHSSPCQNVKAEKCKKEIPNTLPIEMHEWNHSIWCVKRANVGRDYLKKAECPSGYKECYSGGCFAKDCPITKIEIGSNVPLVLAKTPGELPVINVQMTFGDIPCWNQDLYAQTIQNFSYVLAASKETGCNKYGLDSQFSTQISSQTAYDSFAENAFPYPLLSLPHFAENARGMKSILSSKTRMKTAKHDYCLDINPFTASISKNKSKFHQK